MSSVQGVSNVYCQHVPLLMQTIQSAVKGKLKENLFPGVGFENSAGENSIMSEKVQGESQSVSARPFLEEKTRNICYEVREMAADTMATSNTKLTLFHPIRSFEKCAQTRSAQR
tara:strand:+ start:117 stop:458 length:342 start_codon:yes stop_codon:yes gene_type:complete